MPWPMPGMTAEKYAAMVREIRGMSCAIARYRWKQQGDKAGALSAFRDGIQSLKFIVNNAGDAPHDSIDLSAMLRPSPFAGTESLPAPSLPADDVVALATEAMVTLRGYHDRLRDAEKPAP